VETRPDVVRRPEAPAPVRRGPEPGGDSSRRPLEVRDYLAIFRRRRWAMLAVLTAVVTSTTAFTLLRRPSYEATTRLLVQQANVGSGGEQEMPLMADLVGITRARSVQTQIELLKSPLVVGPALDKLPPRLRRYFPRNPEDVNLRVNEVKETDVIDIRVTSGSRHASTMLTDAIAQAYVDESKRVNRKATVEAANYVKGQLNSVRRKLDEARRAIREHKQRTGTFNLSDQGEAQADELARLTAEVGQARAELGAVRAQLRSLQDAARRADTTLVASRTIAQNPLVEKLKAGIADLEVQRSALAAEYTDNSRPVRELDARLAAARRRLEGQVSKVVTSEQHNVNPVRQALVQESARLQALAQAAEARTGGLTRFLNQQQAAMKQLPEEEYRLAHLTTNANVLESTYVMLNEKHQTLQISEQARLASASIVSPARVPLDPVSPNKRLNLALACIVGVLLAIGAALAIDYIDDSIHSADEVTALTQWPVLGHVPIVDSEAQRLVAHIDQRHSGLVESYRMLRSNITFAALDEPLRSMLVTSAGMGEGKTLTACNLATVMAHDGKNVILVDSDLRRPAIHRAFGLANETGFTSVVLGGATLDEALQATEVPGLSILTSGPLPPNPPEVLNSARGRQVIEAIKQRADMVVFDSPPAAALTDAQVLSSSTDGVLLVVASQETTRPMFQRAKVILDHAGANVLGAVLNKLDPAKDGYGDYYYYYYYYHYGDGESGGHRRGRRRRTKSLGTGDSTGATPPAPMGGVH